MFFRFLFFLNRKWPHDQFITAIVLLIAPFFQSFYATVAYNVSAAYWRFIREIKYNVDFHHRKDRGNLDTHITANILNIVKYKHKNMCCLLNA